MRKRHIAKLLFLILLVLPGCARMAQDYETPTVALKTFQLLPAQSLTPKFEIGLHIINPNNEPLKLKGIYYTINVEGHRIVAGVTNKLQEIEGYGSGNIFLDGTVDLLNSARLLHGLLSTPASSLKYSFNAKLDFEGFRPTITVSEQGEFSTGRGYDL